MFYLFLGIYLIGIGCAFITSIIVLHKPFKNGRLDTRDILIGCLFQLGSWIIVYANIELMIEYKNKS